MQESSSSRRGEAPAAPPADLWRRNLAAAAAGGEQEQVSIASALCNCASHAASCGVLLLRRYCCPGGLGEASEKGQTGVHGSTTQEEGGPVRRTSPRAKKVSPPLPRAEQAAKFHAW